MKKLISIGVALALLALVVMPVGAAAAECDIFINSTLSYKAPTTFAKIPFAILESGLTMMGAVLVTLPLGLPTWLGDLMNIIAPWTGGPLSWTVDMLGWVLDLVAVLLVDLTAPLSLPTWLGDVVSGLACSLFTPFVCNVTGVANFTPCS